MSDIITKTSGLDISSNLWNKIDNDLRFKVTPPVEPSFATRNIQTTLKGREGRDYLRNNLNPSLGWSAAGQVVSAGLGLLDSHLGRNDVNLTSKGAQTISSCCCI